MFPFSILMIKKSSKNDNFTHIYVKTVSDNHLTDGIHPKSKRHAKLEISIGLKTTQEYL